MQHNPDLLLKVNTSCYNLTLKTYAKLKKNMNFIHIFWDMKVKAATKYILITFFWRTRSLIV